METERPLKWLLGLCEEDPATVQDTVSSLLQEGPSVLDEMVRCGGETLGLLLNKDAAEDVDKSIVILGARLFHQARAVSILLQSGYIAPSVLLVREMVHTLVLAQFLRMYPEKAAVWLRAESHEERLEFSFGRIWRDVENGEAWREVYFYYSTMAHSNSEAKATYARSRQIMGLDLQLGGFYDPAPIARLFPQAMSFCLWFQGYFCDWYRHELAIPKEVERRLEELDAATGEYQKRLWERAKRESTLATHGDSLPIHEQLNAVVTLRLMIEEKRRRLASS